MYRTNRDSNAHRKEIVGTRSTGLRSYILNVNLGGEYFRLLTSPNALRPFYFFTLKLQDSSMFQTWGFKTGNYYEFGVGWGYSLTLFLKAARSYSRKFNKSQDKFHIYGFDSFEGLPEAVHSRDRNPDWSTNGFAHSLEEIKRKIKKFGRLSANTQFIKGYYENSLTEELREELKANPPSIVNIDVDYYTSAARVLNWLRPILQNGTIFHFDDVWSFFANPGYGELAAIREFNENGDGILSPWNYLEGLGMPTQLIGKVFIYSKRKLE